MELHMLFMDLMSTGAMRLGLLLAKLADDALSEVY